MHGKFKCHMLLLQLSGVLLKKGTKWPKTNVWKSRFFRIEDSGARIAYYRRRDDLRPAGYNLHIHVIRIVQQCN